MEELPPDPVLPDQVEELPHDPLPPNPDQVEELPRDPLPPNPDQVEELPPNPIPNPARPANEVPQRGPRRRRRGWGNRGRGRHHPYFNENVSLIQCTMDSK